MFVTKRDGAVQAFQIEKIHEHCRWACQGLDGASQSELETGCAIQFYDGMPTSEIHESLVTAAADRVAMHQDWAKVAARLLLLQMYKEVTGGQIEYGKMEDYVVKGVQEGMLSGDLLTSGFDYEAIDAAVTKDRDFLFEYLGLQTIGDRYLKRDRQNNLIELPQHMFMRIAMGLALADPIEERTERAIEYYNVYSNFDFMSSTPTLFNSGTPYPQLSSCFLLTMGDDTSDIFRTLHECAQYSKFSGGLGVDFTYLRAQGSHIDGTGGRAGGPIPYNKLYSGVLLGFDQGGKRPGAGAAYLETWHANIEDFLDLRKTTGDENRRAHNVHTATWNSDLFMERVGREEMWSLFDPKDVPDLHDLYGDEFRARYEEYEAMGLAKKTMPAMDLWRKIIGTLFENGGGWPCFKDTANNRNMQKSGIIHSSNLCTEITLNTEVGKQSAVCNLGSVNIATHIVDGKIDYEKLTRTIRTAMRMLDNVLEIGIIPHENGRKFNTEERAVGLGLMGLTEAMAMMGIDFESAEYLEFNNDLMRNFSYRAIEASADLAAERGAYPLFPQSEWAKGILPCDTACDAARELVSGPTSYEPEADDVLREKVSKGMRHSHVMAIAPTATIANITGTTPCTELPLMNEFIKNNLSGNFTVRSPLLKHVPEYLAKTARGVNQRWVIRANAVRQIWIDQAQSLNLYLPLDRPVKGSELASWYTYAWATGNKTTYYLRSVSTEELDELHGGDREDKEERIEEPALPSPVDSADFLAGVVCSLDNPEECEVCQ